MGDVDANSKREEDIGWAILELMGHRKLVGYISEAEIAGRPLLRIDVPQEPPVTEFYSPDAVYCISPTTEATVRGIIAHGRRREPVSRYEVPLQLPAPQRESEIEADSFEDHASAPADDDDWEGF